VQASLVQTPLPPKGPGQRKDCVARTPPKRPGQRKHCSAMALSIAPRRCIREFARVQNCVARTPPKGPGQRKDCVARAPQKRPAQRKSSCSATSVDKVGLQGHVCNRAGNVDGRLTGESDLKPKPATVDGIYFATPDAKDKTRIGEVILYASLAISPPTPSLNVESCKIVSFRRGVY
jgi:hypothetical protein